MAMSSYDCSFDRVSLLSPFVPRVRVLYNVCDTVKRKPYSLDISKLCVETA